MSGSIPLAFKSWQLKLTDITSSWEFYIVTSMACNGLDSFFSNIVNIDFKKPPITQIDSVSIDFATQSLIIGWQRNIEPDVKGYRLYRYDASGISDSLSDTNSNNYSFYQISNNNIDITLSTYDSCYLYSGISDPHKAISLTSTLDTCIKRVKLNWSNYYGWSSSNHTVYMNKNNLGYETLSVLSGSTLNTIYDSLTLGDSICFFVRATKSGDISTTSSSNVTCVYSVAKIPPSLNYISQVTVENNKSVLINWSAIGTQDVSKVQLLRSLNNFAFNPIYTSTISTSTFAYSDLDLNVSRDVAHYKVVLFDVCSYSLGTSNTSSNILLQLDKNILSWNDYSGWLGIIGGYSVFDSSGSTWKPLISNYDQHSFEIINNNDAVEDECLFVLANESGNPTGINSSSKSNTICKSPPFSYFIPNTIVPNGTNNKFVIIGNNIDSLRSNYIVFNRWGEVIFQPKNIFAPWFGEYLGEIVPSGLYFYIANIFAKTEEHITIKGEIRVLR